MLMPPVRMKHLQLRRVHQKSRFQVHTTATTTTKDDDDDNDGDQ